MKILRHFETFWDSWGQLGTVVDSWNSLGQFGTI